MDTSWKKLAAFFAIGGVLVAIVFYLISSASPPSQPPVSLPPTPPAHPVVVNYQIEGAIVDDNALQISIKNGGRSGWVLLSYFTSETTTEVHREAEAKTALKNWFTDEGSPGFTVDKQVHEKGRWNFYVWMDDGATKNLSLPLPGHSTFDDQHYPEVKGVFNPPDNVKTTY